MQKQTLVFPTLADLALFVKTVQTGYLVNTVKCTLTGRLDKQDLQKAIQHFSAKEIETTDKIFTY